MVWVSTVTGTGSGTGVGGAVGFGFALGFFGGMAVTSAGGSGFAFGFKLGKGTVSALARGFLAGAGCSIVATISGTLIRAGAVVASRTVMRTFSWLSSSRLALVAIGMSAGSRSLSALDHFLHVGKSEIARAADRDNRVVDPLPDRFVAQERAGEQLRDQIFRAVVNVALDVRGPAILQHLGTGVAAVEAAHIGEGKLDQPALADDLRQRLRGLRQQLVHEMKAVADILDRGRIFRDPVVGEDEHAVGFRAQIGDGLDRSFAARPAFKGEGLHADHDDLRARFVAQFDQPLRQGDAGRTGQAERRG